MFFQENMLGFTCKTNILECSFGNPIFGMWTIYFCSHFFSIPTGHCLIGLSLKVMHIMIHLHMICIRAISLKNVKNTNYTML